MRILRNQATRPCRRPSAPSCALPALLHPLRPLPRSPMGTDAIHPNRCLALSQPTTRLPDYRAARGRHRRYGLED